MAQERFVDMVSWQKIAHQLKLPFEDTSLDALSGAASVSDAV